MAVIYYYNNIRNEGKMPEIFFVPRVMTEQVQCKQHAKSNRQQSEWGEESLLEGKLAKEISLKKQSMLLRSYNVPPKHAQGEN